MSVTTPVGTTGQALNHRLRALTVRGGAMEEHESAASGHWLAGVLVLGSFVGCLAGSSMAGLIYYAFPVGSACAAFWMLRRHRPYAYVAFSAWMWFLSSFVRRHVDW